jgi:hypothetical protein
MQLERDDDPPTAPGLWKLRAAAPQAGLTPELYEAGSLRGEIPVEVLRIGVRQTRYVRAAEHQHWLRSIPKTL